MDFIDLRSDTVTKPTPEMREALASAEVGDDVFGEDPTVNRLQELAAKMMGKQGGLFVPSGTMGNLIAVLAHCQRGDEAIMGNLGHTFLFEGGGISALGVYSLTRLRIKKMVLSHWRTSKTLSAQMTFTILVHGS
jgi:threonine aldolase